MIEAKIFKDYGSFRLDVEFSAGNEVLALLGGSGSGKSMTLRCIAGVETPDRGRIIVDGQVFFDSEKHINLTPQQRRVGILFQNYALFPTMTVLENIMTGVRTGRKREKWQAAEAALIRYQLEGLGDRYPAELSGGQQQRAALARILVGNPRILMLDEPFLRAGFPSAGPDGTGGDVAAEGLHRHHDPGQPQPGRGLSHGGFRSCL